MKPSYKTHKVKRASTAGGRDIVCSSLFNVGKTKEPYSGTSSKDLSRNTSRKRSHFQETEFNDVEGSVVQVSPSKKRRGFLEMRKTLAGFDSNWEGDSLLHIPEETDRNNDRYRQKLDRNCFPFISTECSDLDHDFAPFIAAGDKNCYSELSASEIIPENLSFSQTPKDEQSDDAKIKTLKEMLPNSSLDDIIIALSSTCGNVERAVEKLKKKDAKSSGLISEPSSLMHLSGLTCAGSTKEWSTNGTQSDEAKIATLQKVLPDSSLENIIVALAASGGNVEEAIRAISNSPTQNPTSYEPENNVNLNDVAKNVKKVSGKCRTVVLRFASTNSYEVKKETDLALNQTSSASGGNSIHSSSVRAIDGDPFDTEVHCYEDFKINAIRNVIPDASKASIVHALNLTKGEIEEAIIKLLNSPNRSRKRNNHTCTVSEPIVISSKEVIDLT